MTKESTKKASKKYDKENTKMLSVKLNKKTDADILEYLKGIGNKQQYIKELIRYDIRAEKSWVIPGPIITRKEQQ